MKYEYFELKEYNEIAKKEKVSILTAKAMEAYNLSNDKNNKINDPYSYKEMDKVVSYIFKAINDKKKIMVYGDYDVDGICSVSILKRMFSLMNTNIGYYLPNRYKDGYGINIDKVHEIHEKGYEIIICIDNGINANEPIKLARELGIDVIVLDHHELVGDIPDCNYFLHPNLSSFAEYNMCASSVAFYLSMAILGTIDDTCAIYAGIATLSDVMPLVEQNKLLVKNALALLNKHKNKNLDLLIENKEYDETTLTMLLIPKLNSVGRTINDIKVNNVIRYLFSENDEETKYLLQFINSCNENRKNISNTFFNNVMNEKFENIIITKDDTLLEGVCGVVAGRLTGSLAIPSIVFALSEDGNFYKGSARGTDNIDLVNCLSKLDYLVSFGGHKKAAGITINKDDFDRFKADLTEIVKNEKLLDPVTKVILLEEDELTYKGYQELIKFAPFGEGNPYPIFALENIDKNRVTLSKDKKHLIIKLNEEVSLVAFNLASQYQEKYNNYRGIFTLDKNNLFKNKLSCKCIEIVGG